MVQAIEEALPNCGDQDQIRLRLFKIVLGFLPASGESLEVARGFFRVAPLVHIGDGSITSRGELIPEITACKNLPPSGDEESESADLGTKWITFRRKVILEEPTLSICAMIQHSQIPCPSKLRKKVVCVLRKAQEDFDFNIANNPLRALMTPKAGGTSIIRSIHGDEDEYEEMMKYLVTLQQMLTLVNDPDDLEPLLGCGYPNSDAVHDAGVAAVRKLQERGVPERRAQRILNKADAAAVRHESLWIDVIKEEDAEPLKRETELKALDESKPGSEPPPTLTQMFGLETIITADDDATSITGLAAYFSYLMQTLRKITIKGLGGKTLQALLLLRRPDLGDLKLSSANVNVLIPYIDLVNEILEAIVEADFKSEEKLSPPFNMGGGDTSESNAAEPKYTNYAVYRDIVQPIVAPLAIFPYNQADHSVRVYLEALGVPRKRLLAAFRAPHRLDTLRGGLESVEVVLDRFYAAEVLGMQEEDQVAIHGSGTYPQEVMADLDEATYHAAIGKKPTAAYWGYDSAQQMLDPENGLGLVKKEFLARAAISFAELLTMLKEYRLPAKIVIVAGREEGNHNGDIAGMRLRLLDYSTGETKSLDEAACQQLQACIRLYKKMEGWSVSEVSLLTETLRLVPRPSLDGAPFVELAAVKELSELTKLSPMQLQPLWGDMNYSGPDSLYHKLFVRRNTHHHETFMPDEDGEVLQGHININEYLQTVLAGLGLTHKDYMALKGDAMEELSLGTISELYRIATLSKAIGISASDYNHLLKLYKMDTPFKTPRTTLAIVRDFLPIKGRKPDLDFHKKLFVSLGVPDASDEECNPSTGKSLQIVSTLTRALGGNEENDREEVKSSAASKRHIVLGCLRSFFPGIDITTLEYLLKEMIHISSGSSDVSAMSRLLLLGQDGPQHHLQVGDSARLPTHEYEGYLVPSVTTTYSVIAPSLAEKTVFLDETALALDSNGACTTHCLTHGRVYKLCSPGPVTLVRPTSRDGTSVNSEDMREEAELLISSRDVEDTMMILSKLMRVAVVIRQYKLEVADIELFNRAKSSMGIDLEVLDKATVDNLQQYQSLRNAFSGLKTAVSSLPTFYLNLSSTASTGRDKLGSMLADVTGWPAHLCAEYIKEKYPHVNDHDLVARFLKVSALTELREAIAVHKKLDPIGVSLSHLFALAQPIAPERIKGERNMKTPPAVVKAFEHAAILRTGIQGSPSYSKNMKAANNELRDAQRSVVVNCLLSRGYAKKNNIRDAEDLFSHLLIDVQMGPSLQTSRLLQAVSTVQFFIQRCLLNAEKHNGIRSTDLIQSKSGVDWDSACRYRLWEAERKTLLHPENWIDPTLRDDKTEQFRALETAMSQKKIDEESIEELIHQYVRDVDSVSNLQVEAYHWVWLDDNDTSRDYYWSNFSQGDFHIFGRTRTSPVTRYYCKMRQRAVGEKEYLCYWTPWAKFPIDAPLYENDPSGNKKRGEEFQGAGSYIVPVVHKDQLKVLLPEFTLMQTNANEFSVGEKSTPDEMMKKKVSLGPKRNWDIRIGLTERSKGAWSTKRVHPTPLRVPEGEDFGTKDCITRVNHLPSLDQFRFQVLDNTESLTYDVECYGSGATKYWKGLCNGIVGRFRLDEQSIHETGDLSSSDNPLFAGPSHFGRFLETEDVDLEVGERNKPTLCPSKIENDRGQEMTDLRRTAFLRDYDCRRRGEFRNTGLVMEARHKGKEIGLLGIPRLCHDEKKWGKLTAGGWESVLLTNTRMPALALALAKNRSISTVSQWLGNLESTYWYGTDILGWSNASKRHHERAKPFSLYTWELAVHIPSLIMERLIATQQYELAIRLVRALVFDPSLSDQSSKCWRFPALRSIIKSRSDEASDPSWKKKMDEAEWRESRKNVHAAARTNVAVYMKRIIIKYIEALIAHGDQYFCQATLETLPMAIQRYTEALHLFGPAPVATSRLGEPAPKSYNELISGDSLFENPEVNLELDFPFYTAPGSSGQKSMKGRKPVGIMRTRYFCIPGNPRVLELRAKIDQRLYNIRHGLDINGDPLAMQMLEPPLDPAAVAGGSASEGKGLAGLLTDIRGPMPKYRFAYLLQRAYDIVGELRATGQQLLAIKEKRDTEALSLLRSKHHGAILELTTNVKEYQKREIGKSMDSLRELRKQQQMRLEYYVQLTGDSTVKPPAEGESWTDIRQDTIAPPTKNNLRMSSYEAEEMRCADEAAAWNEKVGGLESMAAAAFAFPNITTKTQPMGCGIDMQLGGHTVGSVLQSVAAATKTIAQRISDNGAKAGRSALLTRQLQDRRHEANMAGREMVRLDKELAQLQSRLDSHDAEIKVHRREMENLAAEEEWLRSKYTSEQLYATLDNSMATLFHQAYVLATDMVAKTKQALEFEHLGRYGSRQPPRGSGSAKDWEHAKDAQLAGDALYLNLKRMEMAHLENRAHDFEITKPVSLWQLDPVAMLTLRKTGSATFDIPESLLDMDYPGHYCRRISSVAVSVPCILGAYASLSCTVRLVKHWYRLSPTPPASYEQPRDQFRSDTVPIDAIAVSSGLQDAGAFSLDFQTAEKYNPFEGAGAVSTWEVRFPSDFASFDYQTITDLVLHLRYTSLRGDGALAKAATEAVLKKVGSDRAQCMAVNLSTDFPSEWNRCTSAGGGKMKLTGLTNRLPYWARQGGRNVEVNSAALSILPGAPESASLAVDDGESQQLSPTTLGGGLKCLGVKWQQPVSLQGTWSLEVDGGATFSGGYLIIYYRVAS
ncbi:unnamed protein product [Clonostachys solani]|uniref:Uncharacterized protein n=1 Tax=Clonostachys solani TaxID=160281 RepID=A0A9N9ZB05_9HYPO|nr:unnamed protein product [Clonostachys solani]